MARDMRMLKNDVTLGIPKTFYIVKYWGVYRAETTHIKIRQKGSTLANMTLDTWGQYICYFVCLNLYRC